MALTIGDVPRLDKKVKAGDGQHAEGERDKTP